MEEEYLKTTDNVQPHVIESLVRKYWKDIWNFAFVLTNKYDAADDIAQDTFVKAFLSLESFRGESTVKTWLLKICRNQAMNYKRSAFIRKMVSFPANRKVGEQASAESEYFQGVMLDEIWRTLLSLPRHYREVLVLELRYGLSIAEAARILNVAEGTVKSRLNRARTHMRRKIRGG
ncbi:RNA polymerase sigma factor [Paenibacillus sp. J5C_2022]|uniref:RNA polymerase sigma factor n=1 Tax=Paenibacillus sp. J5C2022 TaxID=2977129 RepID=UPI0021CEB0ED|nr:RNA polymerase sigma factor [Paenibacillus sp. J5C2022]MCU6708612.1 RNA polymerase sigma factor [Paenibacillus sp. J5C2022]